MPAISRHYRRYRDSSQSIAGSADGSADIDLKGPGEPKAYVTEPCYVLELRDYSGITLRKEKSTNPYNRDKLYTSGSRHVLEIVRVIQSNMKYRFSDSDEKMMFETAPISTSILNILSPLLLRAMHDIITYYPDRNPYGPMMLPYPFSLLFHHTKELEAYKVTNDSALSPDDVEERNRHIDCALNVVDVEHGEDIIVGKAGQEQTPPVTTFKNYWMLLKFGALVYKRQHGILSTYVVHGVAGGVENRKLEPYVSLWIHNVPSRSGRFFILLFSNAIHHGNQRRSDTLKKALLTPFSYQITLWNLNFDGRRLGRCAEEEFLIPFEGERPITSLSVYPVHFHQDREGENPMKAQMIARGRKFMSLTKPTYCNYDGHTLSSPVRPVSRYTLAKSRNGKRPLTSRAITV